MPKQISGSELEDIKQAVAAFPEGALLQISPDLKQAAELIPNQAMLINTLLLLEAWLLYMLEAVESTAQWTTEKIVTIHNLADHTDDYVREQLPKIYSRELIDTIFEQPYCRIGNLVEADIAKRQVASEYLKKLVSIGVLAEQQVGRERLYIHPKLIQLVSKDSNQISFY